ncbi:MAG: 3-phenylpropionate/trans-cinnamate dioxygenase ferredoxin reductase subunit [Oceanospirillaceae bacterium]|jgi:3-phenylpropionate/trans-cinnamate dioxygenase ferredoxin reductase subunit
MKVVIIGNGISGITAARHIRKQSEHEILVISGETEHFFSRTALMYIYMGHMQYENTKPYEDWFWEKNRIDLKKAWIESIDFDKKSLQTSDNEIIPYDKLILALGSKPNKFGWKGQDLEGVHGMYSFQDLEKLENRSKKIKTGVIVGGGLIGIELAEMLHSRGQHAILLVRENSFWNNVLPKEESEMVNEQIRKNGIELRLEQELDEILGSTEVEAIKTKSGEVINCEFVGLTAGVSPKIELVKDTKLETDRGICINEYLETNIEDVYAIGDCVQHRNPPAGRRSLEQIWYTGRIMGRTVANTICNKREKYDPGVFFNSAKFIDLEYQTYGKIPAKPDEGTSTFCWQHMEDEKLVRINYETVTGKVTGVNTFGIRMRHEIWNDWLKNEAAIQNIIGHLDKANFDPEFYKRYENEIITAYNSETGSSVPLRKKKGLFASLFS